MAKFTFRSLYWTLRTNFRQNWPKSLFDLYTGPFGPISVKNGQIHFSTSILDPSDQFPSKMAKFTFWPLYWTLRTNFRQKWPNSLFDIYTVPFGPISVKIGQSHFSTSILDPSDQFPSKMAKFTFRPLKWTLRSNFRQKWPNSLFDIYTGPFGPISVKNGQIHFSTSIMDPSDQFPSKMAKFTFRPLYCTFLTNFRQKWPNSHLDHYIRPFGLILWKMVKFTFSPFTRPIGPISVKNGQIHFSTSILDPTATSASLGSSENSVKLFLSDTYFIQMVLNGIVYMMCTLEFDLNGTLWIMCTLIWNWSKLNWFVLIICTKLSRFELI